MNLSLKRVSKITFYSLLSLAVLAATAVLVAIGRGYFFDFKTGQIAGGGLILLDSRPSDAQIFLDGEEAGKNTSARIALKAGDYDIKIIKAGYRDWQKRVAVSPSEVTWVRYPLLLSDSISTDTLAPVEAPTIFKQSPDERYLALANGGSTAGIKLIDSNKSEAKDILRLTPEQLAAQTVIESLEWAADNEHLLIGLRTPQAANFIVLNAFNLAESVDVSKEFGLVLNNLQVSPRNWRELYWGSPEGLRKLDLGNKTISAVLAPDISTFLVHEEAVFYLQKKAEQLQLVRLERDNQSRVLADNLPSGDYRLNIAAFGNRQAVVLFDRTTRRASLYYSLTEPGQNLRLFESVTVQSIVVSPEGRYLLMQNGSDFVSYDFEFDKIYRFALPYKNIGELSWLDPFHILTTADANVVMFEFDGGNIETLTDGTQHLPAFASQNLEFVYSFGKSQNNPTVLRISHLKKGR